MALPRFPGSDRLSQRCLSGNKKTLVVVPSCRAWPGALIPTACLTPWSFCRPWMGNTPITGSRRSPGGSEPSGFLPPTHEVERKRERNVISLMKLGLHFALVTVCIGLCIPVHYSTIVEGGGWWKKMENSKSR